MGRWLAALAALMLTGAAAPPRTIAYGADPLQVVDVTAAAGKRAQLVIFVHGGGWRRGDKAAAGAKPDFFTGLGYAFASMNYRLVPQVGVAEQAADLAAAVAKLRAEAPGLGIDPDRIALVGHSAGAHLAALVGTDEHYLKAAGVPLTVVRAIVLLDGAGYDVPRQVADAGPFLKRLYLNAFGDDPATQRSMSPTVHAAAPNVAAWQLFAVANRPDSPPQADALAAALTRAGASATVIRVPDASHASVNRGLGNAGDPVGPAIAPFLKRYL